MWLTYWLIFALFKVVEGAVDSFIGFYLIYFGVKGAFLVWCYHPVTQGAKVVYTTVITPHVAPLIAKLTKKDKEG